MLKDAIGKSRSLSHELSPAVLHDDDFAETLRWLADEVQTKHGLVVHVYAPGQVHSQSEALKGLLYKTARELLFNVVKHARVGEARVRRWGRCIGLLVSDRGRGFDPQELREAAGFGLLSICERIELLGGRMKVRSAPGRGSTFAVAVPEGSPSSQSGSVEEQTAPGRATKPATQDSHARLRVLLADDHQVVREGLAALLNRQEDMEVVGQAAEGREAVDLAQELRPDVVVMDVAMPAMAGDEATRQIKQNLPQTRVVAFSMLDEPDKRETMYQAGAESYVLKTAPFEELFTAIRGKEPES
jgi:CheY-like chemotaxis protein